ncbi:MFS transporter [Roseateles sp. MS654]|uniref:MFS transporter n=1 Tax=Roseateles sp. MS654 TaxID=3412685 RepID=UPI003C2FCFB7
MSAATSRAVVPAVMAGHFAASFAALGMPPFFGLVLEQSLHNDARFLAGWLYVLPTLFAALSSPWWGRLADRYGKKRLLIRAQLGLAASFLLAGFATSTWTFAAALALQGLLGGTFAASNAYLATVASGPALARSLTAMQWSARAALVAAPAALGLLLQAKGSSPIEVYRWMALLPLLAAGLAAFLPAGGAAHRAPGRAAATSAPELSARGVYLLQFGFVFSTVSTFPYFAAHVQQHFAGMSTAAAGLLFGLPHAVYLVAAWPLTRWSTRGRRSRWLVVSFAALLASLLGQAVAASPLSLIACRLLMGAAMTMGFIALHGLIAATVHAGNAGRSFGWFESSSKWGAVAAGLAAGLAAQSWGLRAPFWLAAAALIPALAGLAVVALRRLPSGSALPTASSSPFSLPSSSSSSSPSSSSDSMGAPACTRPTPGTQS